MRHITSHWKTILLGALSLMLFRGVCGAFELNPADVETFRNKCSKCHTLDRVFKDFKPGGELVGKELEVVKDMQSKKPDFISDQDVELIVKLLGQADMGKLQAAVNASAPGTLAPKSGDGKRSLKIVHGVWQAAAFILLGCYMLLTGLGRILDQSGMAKGFPVKFNWKRHVMMGKIYAIAVSIGLALGYVIWALNGFNTGIARFHLIAAFLILALYSIGNATGCFMSQGKAGPKVKYIHAACNLSATALFIFNIVTGIKMLLS